MDDHLLKCSEDKELIGRIKHDLASPLMTLNTIFNLEGRRLIENYGLIIRSAQRIRCIVSDYIEGPKNQRTEYLTKEQFVLLITEGIKAKEIEFRTEHGVRFDFQDLCTTNKIKVFATRTRMTEIFSNLLNNAIEASSGITRKITIRTSESSSAFFLSVANQTQEAASQFIKQLSRNNLRFSTKGLDRGYGIFHARQYMESVGGIVHATSSAETGTIVKLEFPRQFNTSISPSQM